MVEMGAPAHPGGLSRRELAALGQDSPRRSLPAGHFLFRQGASLEHVYVVTSGLVRLGRDVEGKRTTLLLAGEGDLLGDLDLLLNQPAPCDASALIDTMFVAVPGPRFVTALCRGPGFAARWAVGLAGRIARCQGRLEELLAGDVRARLATLLLHQSRAAIAELTQQTIAELLGTTRTSVNRALRDLESQGILRVGYREIVIWDHAALAGLATPGDHVHARQLSA